MADVTVVSEGEGGDTPPSPTEEAVAAVEVLEAARAAGRQEGFQDAAMAASVSALNDRVGALESFRAEAMDALALASQVTAAQSQAIADLNARLAQEQAAHVEAVEEVVETETTDPAAEQEPEPVVDRTPTRKRHWT